MGLGSITRKSKSYREFATQAELYALPASLRQWGERYTVYNDGVNNGEYVLVYNLSSTSKSDNSNFQVKSLPALSNVEGVAAYNSITEPGVRLAQGANAPVVGAVCMVLCSKSGTTIQQHAIIISGAGTPGNVWYRAYSGGAWGAWALVNS